MKILSIPEQHDIDIGSVSPALEGFLSDLKGVFFKDKKKERVDTIKKNTFEVYRELESHLESDLKATYDNHRWVEANLPAKDSILLIPALEYANANMKQLRSPSELVKIAETMLAVIKELARLEKPFIDYRKKLCDQLDKMTDPAKADKLWLDNQKALSPGVGDRYIQRSKKYYPAFGMTGKEGNTWPALIKNKHNYLAVGHSYVSYRTSGKFDCPTVNNANDFAKSIRRLLAISVELSGINKEIYVPYWDGTSLEYDALKYGDDIFSKIYSSQSSEELHELSIDLHWTIGRLIAGLYVAMFDKNVTTTEE